MVWLAGDDGVYGSIVTALSIPLKPSFDLCLYYEIFDGIFFEHEFFVDLHRLFSTLFIHPIIALSKPSAKQKVWLLVSLYSYRAIWG
jgi:hypothetical protein